MNKILGRERSPEERADSAIYERERYLRQTFAGYLTKNEDGKIHFFKADESETDSETDKKIVQMFVRSMTVGVGVGKEKGGINKRTGREYSKIIKARLNPEQVRVVVDEFIENAEDKKTADKINELFEKAVEHSLNKKDYENEDSAFENLLQDAEGVFDFGFEDDSLAKVGISAEVTDGQVKDLILGLMERGALEKTIKIMGDDFAEMSEGEDSDRIKNIFKEVIGEF